MYNPKTTPNRLIAKIPASFEAIDLLCADLKKLLTRWHLAEEIFAITLGSREALTNAIRHGCQMNLKREIVYQITRDKTCLTVEVQDEGPGFDWKAEEQKKCSDVAVNGRGLEIFKLYFDTFHFNDAGNKITLIKQIQPKRGDMSEIIRNNDNITIKPGSDIVASMVENFKTELKTVLKEGVQQLTLDLSDVEMIDSMGIGILIATHNSLKKQNEMLRITGANSNISSLLKNMRLDKHFHLE